MGGFPGGPLSEERELHAEPGTVLPEETFVLARTCAVLAVLLDASGNPAAEESFTLEARYSDGEPDRAYVRTDRDGRFELQGKLRALTMTIRLRGAQGRWEGDGLDGSGGALDLGQIALDPAHAE